MTRSPRYCIPLGHVILLLSYLAVSQATSTSSAMNLLPVPPMQWLNLTNLLSGPAAPPLMDASIGYDNITRKLLIFGGESGSGIAQSSTYLLDLDTLIWTTPTPPTNLGGSPSARSAALSGEDFAASNRHAHVVIGGKNGTSALSDIWEFDYNNQFWAQVNLSPGGPSPRWGVSGGLDIQVAAISDPTIPGPNNTFYLAGGTTESGSISISDVWELHLAGTLSSNLPNAVTGSWQHVPIGDLPKLAKQAGTVVGSQIIAASGCNTTTASNDSCAQQSSYVLQTDSTNEVSPGNCPAPRFGGAMARNYNAFSATFSTQVFLLAGIFNSSLWSDGGGLQKGEVDILDVNAGTWSRVLPSGDPGISGVAAFPSPREGAAVLSFQTTLVGSSRTIGSDTIIFGGRDASGNYLQELWLLRTYNDKITSPGQEWTGFGDGKLQTGVDANGAGVTIQYITECASAITTSPTSTTSSPAATSSSSSKPQLHSQLYTVSKVHTILAPVSIGLLLPAILLLRLALPSANISQPTERNIALVYMSALVAIGAYATGIVGLASSFTTITSIASVQKRTSSSIVLKTVHGKAGLALFVCLYGAIPILYLIRECRCHRSKQSSLEKAENAPACPDSTDTVEKPTSISIHPASTIQSSSSPSSSGHRAPGWRGHGLWPGSRTLERVSSDESMSESESVAVPSRPFEVVNRPQRGQRLGSNGTTPQYSRSTAAPRFLGDLDWLDRRRSLNAVGELDYALNHVSRMQGVATPATTDIRSSLVLMTPPTDSFPRAEWPRNFDIFLRIFLHLSLLAICVLSLAALWSHKTGFAVFLAWMMAFYVLLFVFAWHGRSRQSILTVIITRLRANPPNASEPSPGLPLSAADQYPLQTDTRGPYVHHQPPYRAIAIDDLSTTQGDPRSTENDDDDEEDEDARQRRIEDEMARREVSIITVPRRKLWITNPEDSGSS